MGWLGYGLQNLLAVTVIAIWIIFSSILAPVMIQRLIASTPGPASVLTAAANLVTGAGLPLFFSRFTRPGVHPATSYLSRLPRELSRCRGAHSHSSSPLQPDHSQHLATSPPRSHRRSAGPRHRRRAQVTLNAWTPPVSPRPFANNSRCRPAGWTSPRSLPTRIAWPDWPWPWRSRPWSRWFSPCCWPPIRPGAGVRYLVLDPAGNWTLAPGTTFAEASELHVQQALLATTALLLRNPAGFDQPEVLEALFGRNALAQATHLRGLEGTEFHERQLHQKPQVARINAIETRDDRAQIEVTGTLLRTGLYQKTPFAEVLPFRLRLTFRPNPDLLRNRRQPTLVTEFELAYEPPPR
ncbi:MAG: hypothetical protein M5U12_12615 [Verrucomicrobia bacterium]|nr:hypothetical protein [Verrucomicrobiota bacterium]